MLESGGGRLLRSSYQGGIHVTYLLGQPMKMGRIALRMGPMVGEACLEELVELDGEGGKC